MKWGYTVSAWMRGMPGGDPVWGALKATPLAYFGRVNAQEVRGGTRTRNGSLRCRAHACLPRAVPQVAGVRTPMWQPPDVSYLVRLTDGNGTDHHLHLVINQGNPDGPTGMFGYVDSAEGVWCRFSGYTGVDYGTHTAATSLAIRRFAPHKTDYRGAGLLPDGSTWSFHGNQFQTHTQVEVSPNRNDCAAVHRGD